MLRVKAFRFDEFVCTGCGMLADHASLLISCVFGKSFSNDGCPSHALRLHDVTVAEAIFYIRSE